MKLKGLHTSMIPHDHVNNTFFSKHFANHLLINNCLPFSFLNSQSLLTFELFSVMVHSGSAAGGHYYAHIKSFSDGQWYSFNDQHVSKVSLWL